MLTEKEIQKFRNATIDALSEPTLEQYADVHRDLSVQMRTLNVILKLDENDTHKVDE